MNAQAHHIGPLQLDAFVAEINAQERHNREDIKLPDETCNYIRQNQINVILKTATRLRTNFNPDLLFTRLEPGAKLRFAEWFSTREALAEKRRNEASQ